MSEIKNTGKAAVQDAFNEAVNAAMVDLRLRVARWERALPLVEALRAFLQPHLAVAMHFHDVLILDAASLTVEAEIKDLEKCKVLLAVFFAERDGEFVRRSVVARNRHYFRYTQIADGLPPLMLFIDVEGR